MINIRKLLIEKCQNCKYWQYDCNSLFSFIDILPCVESSALVVSEFKSTTCSDRVW